MSITRSEQIFRTLSGRILANQQEEFEYLSDSQQSESVSFVTARSSSDPPPTYEETVQTENYQLHHEQAEVHIKIEQWNQNVERIQKFVF
ncbi:31863_t:CDS:2, partial [Gigaspora margarita]